MMKKAKHFVFFDEDAWGFYRNGVYVRREDGFRRKSYLRQAATRRYRWVSLYPRAGMAYVIED